MLFILFQLGQDRYAIDARELVEILPLMRIKRLPQAPMGVAGVIDYRTVPTPVIDLCAMALGRAAAERISTRILVVQLADGNRIGLMAEKANEMLRRDLTDFENLQVAVDAAPYLGPITRDARGLVQWIVPEKLLTKAIRDALFQCAAEAA